jgi:hypothetical protein
MTPLCTVNSDPRSYIAFDCSKRAAISWICEDIGALSGQLDINLGLTRSSGSRL